MTDDERVMVSTLVECVAILTGSFEAAAAGFEEAARGRLSKGTARQLCADSRRTLSTLEASAVPALEGLATMLGDAPMKER